MYSKYSFINKSLKQTNIVTAMHMMCDHIHLIFGPFQRRIFIEAILRPRVDGRVGQKRSRYSPNLSRNPWQGRGSDSLGACKIVKLYNNFDFFLELISVHLC